MYRYCTTPNAYRSRVLYYEKAINIPSDIVTEDEESVKYREEYKDKYKQREWYNAYRRSIREEIRLDNLKDEIKEAADKFSKLPSLKLSENTDNLKEKEAVLLFSDLHIGVECDNYYNKYNSDIAVKRLNSLRDQVIEYCRLNKVSTLHFLNLGDAISGLIHTNARIEQQMDVAEQVIVAAELISQFLYSLLSLNIKIDYRSVFDNHSRLIADKHQHIEKEQLSRLIDWFVSERLKDTNIQFIDDNIDGGIGKFKIFDKTAMCCHGHEDSRTGIFQPFIGVTREWVDYIFMAHYHNPAEKDYQGCKVFINGSIVGVDQYAFSKRLFTKPSQKLLIFTKDSDTIQDIDIMLN